MKILRIFVLALFAFTTIKCCGQNRNEFIVQFISRDRINPVDAKAFADSLNTIGKDAIACLIDNIVRSEKVKIDLGKPMVSSFPTYYWKENYCGIRSAYFIEWLLWSKNPQSYDYDSFYKEIGGEVPESFRIAIEYYKFKFNVLIKDGDKQLMHEDMLVIQSIYKKWWEKNKSLSLNELREKYENDPIWKETPYRWN